MNADRTARLEKKLAGLARTRHIPKLETGEAKKIASQIGGVAWLAPSTKWPKCKSCKKPMQLILQLRADDAPADSLVIPKGKVAQIFHCGRSRCDEGYTTTPDGHGKLVRFIDEKGAVRAPDAPDHLAIGKRIVGFDSAPEVPGRQDLRDNAAAKLNAKEMSAVGDSEQRPYGRTKIGGWADWIQSAESPSCEKCDQKMRFALQLQGGEIVDFGDSGLAYLHQCTTHTDQFAMGWSST
jgi:hypothetical protein